MNDQILETILNWVDNNDSNLKNENIHWLMASSATVDKIPNEFVKETTSTFLKILSDFSIGEPIIADGSVSFFVSSEEIIQIILRRLKALGYFFFVRSSRMVANSKLLNPCDKRSLLDYPYSIVKTVKWYCNPGRQLKKVSACKAVMHMKLLDVYTKCELPSKTETPALWSKTFRSLKNEIAEGTAFTEHVCYIKISMPEVHSHQLTGGPGHQLDPEVKAIMFELVQSGVKTIPEIQTKLRLIINKEFDFQPSTPSLDNSAFFPTYKVIYNHLRCEGLALKHRKNWKIDVEKAVVATSVVTLLATLPVLVLSDQQQQQSSTGGGGRSDDCQVTPVIHVLQYPGCVPKPIPSFACTGRCASYLQVSGSKIWQMERSCMCCQESGEREASVSLFCPKAKPGERKFRKVTTKAPLECMCRPCTGVEESAIVPQEIAGYADEGPLNNHFRKSSSQ